MITVAVIWQIICTVSLRCKQADQVRSFPSLSFARRSLKDSSQAQMWHVQDWYDFSREASPLPFHNQCFGCRTGWQFPFMLCYEGFVPLPHQSTWKTKIRLNYLYWLQFSLYLAFVLIPFLAQSGRLVLLLGASLVFVEKQHHGLFKASVVYIILHLHSEGSSTSTSKQQVLKRQSYSILSCPDIAKYYDLTATLLTFIIKGFPISLFVLICISLFLLTASEWN